MIRLASSEYLTGDEVNQVPIRHASYVTQTLHSDTEDHASQDEEVAANLGRQRPVAEAEAERSLKDRDRHIKLLEDELATVRRELENERQRGMRLQLQAPTQQRQKQSQMIQTECHEDIQINDQQVNATSIARDKHDAHGGKELGGVQWLEKQDLGCRQEKEGKWNDLKNDMKKVQELLAEVRGKVEKTNAEIGSKLGKGPFQVP
jgi:acetyl/propionyl-CoA carboxylase alpha subunit